jgi:hypothetical protein
MLPGYSEAADRTIQYLNPEAVEFARRLQAPEEGDELAQWRPFNLSTLNRIQYGEQSPVVRTSNERGPFNSPAPLDVEATQRNLENLIRNNIRDFARLHNLDGPDAEREFFEIINLDNPYPDDRFNTVADYARFFIDTELE